MFNLIEAIEKGRTLVPNLVVELEARDEMILRLIFTSESNKGTLGVRYEVSWIELLETRECVLDKAFTMGTEAIAKKYREEEELTWATDY